MTKPEPLFRRDAANPILSAADVPYPANSVFNPAAARVGNETILLVRVEDLRGISQLHVARSADGVTDWRFDPEPLLQADVDRDPEETWGCEDPRVTWLPEREEWAIAYTAYSRRGPLVGLATTRDFSDVRRLGPVMPPEDKDAALFPRRFDGRWAMIHRPSPLRGGAHMWLSYSPDMRHWGDHKLLIEAREGAWWDAGKIGLGPPPLETPQGWLVMYHGVRVTSDGPIYRVGLALLDLEDPGIAAPSDRHVGVRSRCALRDHRRRRSCRLSMRLGPRSGERPTAPLLRRRGQGHRAGTATFSEVMDQGLRRAANCASKPRRPTELTTPLASITHPGERLPRYPSMSHSVDVFNLRGV